MYSIFSKCLLDLIMHSSDLSSSSSLHSTFSPYFSPILLMKGKLRTDCLSPEIQSLHGCFTLCPILQIQPNYYLPTKIYHNVSNSTHEDISHSPNVIIILCLLSFFFTSSVAGRETGAMHSSGHTKAETELAKIKTTTIFKWRTGETCLVISSRQTSAWTHAAKEALYVHAIVKISSLNWQKFVLWPVICIQLASPWPHGN